MRKSGVAEKYVGKRKRGRPKRRFMDAGREDMTVVEVTQEDSTTAVRCAVGVTEGFDVKMGLHQGSTLSPCLFAMVMDIYRLTDEIRLEAPWTMMFADDFVICSESKEHMEDKLGSWRYALERRGMKDEIHVCERETGQRHGDNARRGCESR